MRKMNSFKLKRRDGGPEGGAARRSSPERSRRAVIGYVIALAAAVIPFVPALFSRGNELAEAHDGMWQSGGIAHQQVEQPAGQQRKDTAHRRSSRY